MSQYKSLNHIEALEMFKEHHPEINSIEQILEFTEARFVETFTTQPPFNGDIRKARKTYRSAQRVQEQITLLWANIKDTIGSPSIRNTLFNNIPDSFFEHQNLIPAYNKIFGNLDYTETDHSRSVLGPAAYFVDLMRFIEKHITPSLKKAIAEASTPKEKEDLEQHLLENRQPRLFQIPLDEDSTFNLIPYIDIVNETLEDVVRQKDKSPYEVLEEQIFPMDLPFHLPLEEIRLYLAQLEISLQEIYRLFSTVGPLAFNKLAKTNLNEDDSQAIYKDLQTQNILDFRGTLTAKFKPNNPTFNITLTNPEYNQYRDQIIQKLKEYENIESEIARESLTLSPRERDLIENSTIASGDLGLLYGTRKDIYNQDGNKFEIINNVNAIIVSLNQETVSNELRDQFDEYVTLPNTVKTSVVKRNYEWRLSATEEINGIRSLSNGKVELIPSTTEIVYWIQRNPELNQLTVYLDVSLSGKDSLEDVEFFIGHTGLKHKELYELLFLDLSDAEINSGLARLLFINNTGDLGNNLRIENDYEKYIGEIEDFTERHIRDLENQHFPDDLRPEFQRVLTQQNIDPDDNSTSNILSAHIKILKDVFTSQKIDQWVINDSYPVLLIKDKMVDSTFLIREQDGLLHVFEAASELYDELDYNLIYRLFETSDLRFTIDDANLILRLYESSFLDEDKDQIKNIFNSNSIVLPSEAKDILARIIFLKRLFLLRKGENVIHAYQGSDILFVTANPQLLESLNLSEFPSDINQQLQDLFGGNNIRLSSDLGLNNWKTEKWKIWDSEKDKKYFMRQVADESSVRLVISDQPYDRLANLTIARLDRIYRFLKLFRKLSPKTDISFADLDWALRTLQGTDMGEKVLRFDGVNDYVDIQIQTYHLEDANQAFAKQEETASTFTLEAWINPALAGNNPIFAKGSHDSGDFEASKLQFLFWVAPQGKLAFTINQDQPINTDSWGQSTLKQNGTDPSLWHESRLKGGKLVALNLTELPYHHADASNNNYQHGITLLSDGTVPQGIFSHVAVSVNESPEADSPSDTHYQLKFYINGVLDSTWTLDNPLQVASVPNGAEQITINIGKDLLNEYFSGDITELRLWGGILPESEINNHRFQRCHSREIRRGNIRLIAYWPLIESLDLQVRDLAFYDAAGNPKLHPQVYTGILGGTNHHSIPLWVHGDIGLDPLPANISDRVYHFNGTDEYLGSSVKNLDLSTLTLEAWVEIQQPGVYPIITQGEVVSTRNSLGELVSIDVQTRYKLWLEPDATGAESRIVFWHVDIAGNAGEKYTSSRSINNEQPTHIAVVWQGTEVTFFINGESDTPTPVFFSEGPVPLDFDEVSLLYLGRDFNNNYFQGTLQEVRIWDHQRTGDQIETAQHHQLSGREPGLAGYWRLDEANPHLPGVQARDLTFNQNHLLPGGIPSLYHPTLTQQEDIILPNPVQTTSPALSFDQGQTPVIIQNQKRRGLGYSEQFTVEFWFKADEPGVSDRKQILLSQGDRKTGLNLYLFEGTAFAYAWQMDLDGAVTQEMQLQLTLIDTQWHHLTFTYDETTESEIEILTNQSQTIFNTLDQQELPSDVDAQLLFQLLPDVDNFDILVDIPTQEWRLRDYVNNETYWLRRNGNELQIYRKTLEDEIAYTLYLDGGEQISSTLQGFRLDQVGDIYLGNCDPDGFTRFHDGVPNVDDTLHFQGQITDFRLWDISLSRSSISRPLPPSHPRHIPPQTTDHLLCYFPMTEGYGRNVSNHTGPRFQGLGPTIPDQSPNQHHGQLSVGPDTPTWQQDITDLPVYRDTVLELNGSDQYLHLPCAAELNLIDHDFTIEVWVKVSAFNDGMPILGSHPPHPVDFSLAPKLTLSLTTTGQVQAQLNEHITITAEGLVLNAWHHLAWSYQQEDERMPATHRLYIDGQLKGQSQDSQPGLSQDLLLYLGYRGYRSDQSDTPTFAGQITELRIWSTARTDADIQTHRNLQIQDYPEDLEAYWLFDHDPRSIILDLTAQSHRAIVELAPDHSLANKWETTTSAFKRQALALHLNPDQKAPIDFVDLDSYSIRNQGTVELWVKFSPQCSQILFDASAATGEVPFTIDIRARQLRFLVVDNAWHRLCAQIDLSNVSSEFDTQFHHLVATWDLDQRRIQLYLDDGFKALDTHSSTDLTTGRGKRPDFQSPYIGLDRTAHQLNFTNEVTAALPFQGQISQLRIWDHVRARQDLQRLRYADLEGQDPDGNLSQMEQGLVVYLPILGEQTHRLLDLATGHHLPIRQLPVPHPDPQWQVVDYYLDLDGIDDFIHLEHYRPTASGTIELWTQFSANRNQILFDASNDKPYGKPNLQKYFLLEVRDRTLRFKLEDANDLDFKVELPLDNNSLATFEQQWHHVVATWQYDERYNAVTAQLYLDDVNNTAETCKPSLTPQAVKHYIQDFLSPNLGGDRHPSLRTLFLGQLRGTYYTDHSGFGAEWFNGNFRQVRIWDHIRSPQDLEALRDVALQEPQSGLLVNLLLNEGQGDRLKNLASHQPEETAAELMVAVNSEIASKWHPYDHAVMLNGIDTLIDLYDYSPAAEGSIEIWAQFSRNRDQILFDASDLEHGFTLDVMGGCLRFRLSQGEGASIPLRPLPISFDQGWHHIVAAWHWHPESQIVTTRLFLDGQVQDATQTPTSTTWPNLPNLYIGRPHDLTAASTPFLGRIRQLRVWQWSRTSEQVQYFRYAGLTGNESGLIAYIPIDEATGYSLRNRVRDQQGAILKQGFAPSPTWLRNPTQLFCFKPEDYVVLPDTSTLELISNDFTIEVTVCLQDLEKEQTLLGIRGPRDPDNFQAQFAISVNTGGQVQMHFQGRLLAAEGLELQALKWYQIVCQYSQTDAQLRLYVAHKPAINYLYNHDQRQLVIQFPRNYALVPYELDHIEPYTADRRLYLGYNRQWDSEQSGWKVQFCHGFIDEVRFWNSIRTCEQLLEHHDRRLRGDEPNLAAYWSMTSEHHRTVFAQGVLPQRAQIRDHVTDIGALFISEQPQIFLPRSAPRLDGYNDYLDLHRTFLRSTQARTIEYWYTDDQHQWHHLAAIYDNATSAPTYFVNGKNPALTEPPAAQHAKIFDQVTPPHPAEFFTGQIAEIRFWQSARTLAEIQADYQRILTGREAHLWAYWPLTEGDGPQLLDASETLAPATYEPGLENAEDKWHKLPSSPFDPAAESALYFDGQDDHIELGDVVDLELDQSEFDPTLVALAIRLRLQPQLASWLWLMVVLSRAQASQSFTVEAWVKLDAHSNNTFLPILGSTSTPTADGYRTGIFLGFKQKRPYWRFVQDFGLILMSPASTEALPSTGRSAVIIAKIDDFYHVRIFNWTGSMVIDQGRGKFTPNERLLKELKNVFALSSISVQQRRSLIQQVTASLGRTLDDNFSLQSQLELDENWHHVVWQYFAFTQTMSIQVDGQQVAHREQLAPPIRDAALAIGQGQLWNVDTGEDQIHIFQGWMAEVRIWRTALTDEGLARYQQRPLPGNSEVLKYLVAYWIFDDRNRTMIPSRVLHEQDNSYRLFLESDSTQDQPTWIENGINDHPILLNPLPQAALAFDGNTQYLATDEFRFISTNSDQLFTLEAWVKVDDLSSPHSVIWWGEHNRLTSSRTRFEIQILTDGNLVFYTQDATPLVTTTDAPITPGTFAHIAVVTEAATSETRVTLFVNGEEKDSDTTSNVLIDGGKILQVGRGDRGDVPQYFKGTIQELRIWDGPKDAQFIQRHQYHPLTHLEALTDLLAYWPLTITEQSQSALYTPNETPLHTDDMRVSPPLRLGGLASSRRPLAGEPEGFLDARRRVLTFPLSLETPELLSIPSFKPQTHAHRSQRTIEVWFQCQDPFRATKQIVYEEGDCDRNLKIYIQQGELRFEGVNRPEHESDWTQPSRISTIRIQPGHWHHAVLVLDGSNEVHDNVLCALLDGRVINTQPGSQLWRQTQALCVGGLRLVTPANQPLTLAANHYSKQKGDWIQSKTITLQVNQTARDEHGHPAALEYLHPGAPGVYQIWLRYPTHPHSDSTADSFATNVPIDIIHRKGTKRYVVNQQAGGGTWQLLGQWELAPIESKIRISNQDTDGTVVIDQLRLVPVDATGQVIPAQSPIAITADQYSAIQGQWSQTESVLLQVNPTARDQTGVPACLHYLYRGTTGRCQIRLRYPIHPHDATTPAYASNVPVTIQHRAGTTTFEINQRNSGPILYRPTGDKWQEIDLGQYDLESGQSQIHFSNKDIDGLVIIGELEFIYQPSIDPYEQLQGQIKEVRVWERVRSLEQLQDHRFELPADDNDGLLFHWQTEQLAQHPPQISKQVLSPMQLPAASEPELSAPTLPLTDLAHTHQLLAEAKLPLNRLSTLWANLKHTGVEDNRTLFDDIFNSGSIAPNQQWSYAMRLRWEARPAQSNDTDLLARASEAAQRQIRSRLMGALRVSSADLDQMLTVLSGEAFSTIILDGHYLSQLYRFRLLAILLKLSIQDLVALYQRFTCESQAAGIPFNEIAKFTVTDVMQLQQRANWMQETGIDIAEYNYLAYDETDQRVAPPFTNATVVDMATDLLNRFQEFLLTPISFVTDSITELASTAIYDLLTDTEQISPIQLALPTQASNAPPEGTQNNSLELSVVNPVTTVANGEDTNPSAEAYLRAIGEKADWLAAYSGLQINGEVLRRKADYLLTHTDPDNLLLQSIRTSFQQNPGRHQLSISLPDALRQDFAQALARRGLQDQTSVLSEPVIVQGSEWILLGQENDPAYIIQLVGQQLRAHEILNPLLFSLSPAVHSEEDGNNAVQNENTADIKQLIHELNQGTVPVKIQNRLEPRIKSKGFTVSTREWLITDRKNNHSYVIKYGKDKFRVCQPDDQHLFYIDREFQDQLDNGKFPKSLRKIFKENLESLSPQLLEQYLDPKGKIKITYFPTVTKQSWKIQGNFANEVLAIEVTPAQDRLDGFQVYQPTLQAVPQRPTTISDSLFTFDPALENQLNSNRIPDSLRAIFKHRLDPEGQQEQILGPEYVVSTQQWLMTDADPMQSLVIRLNQEQVHIYAAINTRELGNGLFNEEFRSQLDSGQLSQDFRNEIETLIGMSWPLSSQVTITRTAWLLQNDKQKSTRTYSIEKKKDKNQQDQFYIDGQPLDTDQDLDQYLLSFNFDLALATQLDQYALEQSERDQEEESKPLPQDWEALFNYSNAYLPEHIHFMTMEWKLRSDNQRFTYTIRQHPDPEAENTLDAFGGWIDNFGQVTVPQPELLTLQQLKQAYRRTSIIPVPEVDTTKLFEVRDLLLKNKEAQANIPAFIETVLVDRRVSMQDSLYVELAELLETNVDLLRTIISTDQEGGTTYSKGQINAQDFLEQLNRIQQTEDRDQALEAVPALHDDLKRISKILFLLSQFDLSEVEQTFLLSQPSVFGLTNTSLVRPSLADLTRLHTFVQLKTALNDPGDVFVRILSNLEPNGPEISALTGWSVLEQNTLAQALNLPLNAHSLLDLDQLSQAFQLIIRLGADAKYLVDLADLNQVKTIDRPQLGSESNFDFYQRHAETLLNLVQAKYDEEQWVRVYKPLHDRIATHKRDALTAVAIEKYAEEITGRKGPDLLYEYLLVDVQTGSEVNTSRIVQANASLQLYIQRCLMSLERGIYLEEKTPGNEWIWIKNYRVWEANRKVFLYPENYIEPELRDTKTPEFEILQEELSQDKITKDTTLKAIINYLDKFRDLANLKIIGSYLYKGANTQGKDVVTLYLVGRTASRPNIYYYREYLVSKDRWLPWKKIDLSINSDFVSPVYAFNKLFIFWAELTVITKAEDIGGETVDRDFYQPVVKYSYYNFSGTWTVPQTYFELPADYPVHEDRKAPLYLRRVFVQNIKEFVAKIPTDSNRNDEDSIRSNFELVKTMRVSKNANLRRIIPSLDMTRMTWSFWINIENLFTIPIGEILEEELPKKELFLFRYKSPQSEGNIIEGTIKNKFVEIEKISTIKEELDKAQNTAVENQNNYNTKQINVNERQNVFNERQSKVAENQNDFNHKQTNIVGIQIRITNAQLDLTNARIQLDNANTVADQNTAQQALTEAQNELNQAQEELITARNELEQAREELITAQNELEKAREDLTIARNELEQAQEELTTAQNNLEQQQRAWEEALRKPHWQAAIDFRFKINDQEFTNPALKLNTWQYVTISCNHSNNTYDVTFSIFPYDADSSQSELKNYQLMTTAIESQQQLLIGQADLDNIEEVFKAQMSEFQISTDQEIDNLIRDRYTHKENISSGLRLALDGREENIIVEQSTLRLIFFAANIISIDKRERILILYYNQQKILRETLDNELHFTLNLDINNPENERYDYDLLLHESQRVNDIDTSMIEPDNDTADQADSLKLSIAYSEILLDYGEYLVADQYQELPDQGYRRDSDQAQGLDSKSKIFLENNVLLDNLKTREVSLLDVNNQPGWYILDTGDEQFLIQVDEELMTTEDRLVAEYKLRQENEPQPVRLSLFKDENLSVEKSDNVTPPSFKYKFIRLDTSAIHELSKILFKDGINGLLSLKSQDIGKSEGSDFIHRYGATEKYVDPPSEEFSTVEFTGANGIYCEELFFHIPFFIANQLNLNQEFSEAQKWYHFIFNPNAQDNSSNLGTSDRYWRYKPFQNQNLETLSQILSNTKALEEYREDPFDPHTIANLRLNAYQKTVVMKYIDNLLDWGDYLFRQDTRESINEAINLYVLGFNLLGPRPQARPQQNFEPTGTFQDVQADLRQNNISELPDFLISEMQLTINNEVENPFDPNRTTITRFYVPENTHFIEYWGRVEDRLYKIRHSLNIDGVFRTLDLFQPPIDPAILVRAVAGGGLSRGINAALTSVNMLMPHYRYTFMLEKAKELTRQTLELGGALLDALEKKDAEELRIIQHSHELHIMNLTTGVKKLQIEELQTTLGSLKESLANAKDRKLHYEGLIDRGISILELRQISFIERALAARQQAGNYNIQAARVGTQPDTILGISGGLFASPAPNVTTSYGGTQIARSFELEGIKESLIADERSTESQNTGLMASYERREEDWELQKTIAEHDIAQNEQQILSAETQIEIASNDLNIHETAIKQNKEIGDFYNSKFTNKELYNWMVSRLSGLYFQTYKLSFDLARKAEKAFQFEYANNDTFISFGYWDSLRRGLTAGEALRLDLTRLEKASLDQNKRYLEITKHISLLQLDPLALIEFKETGRCQFSLGELLFDRDYPGHYCRMIKTVSISMPAVVGPYQTFKATLTQTGNKTLLAPNIDGVRYLLGEEQDTPPVIRADFRANQQIAISTGVEDSGMFELNFGDPRYLPFEGTGAVSNWLLNMPKASNPIDFNTISDIIIHIRYTSKSDGGLFKQQVMDLEVVKSYQGVRLLSLAHDFSSEWQIFKTNPARAAINFPITRHIFPPNVNVDLNVDPVIVQQIYSLDKNGQLTEVKSLFEVVNPNPQDNSPTFELRANKRFNRTEVETLLVFVFFSGQLTT